MKKLILFMVMLAITFGTKAATADTLHVPLVAHYGASDKTMMTVTNLASETVAVSITYLANVDDGGTGWATTATNTLAATTIHGTSLAPNNTFLSYSDQTLLFGSTTNIKRATVTMTSSGAIQGSAIFVHLSAAGAPTGFVYPVAYQRQTWTTSKGIAADNSVTMQSWLQ